MKHIGICIFILFIATILNAQTISVRCNIMNGGQGQTLRVNKYTDYLTEMEETIFQTIIDKNQTVVLTIDANETSEYIFYIDFAEASAILQPNTNYLINIFIV